MDNNAFYNDANGNNTQPGIAGVIEEEEITGVRENIQEGPAGVHEIIM